MSEFLKDIAKMNEYGGIVDDGVETGDVDSFIDTGSYIFNALLSGSVNGCLLYTSPSPRDMRRSRMPSSA